jgi:COP9 signalosome complex subunit 12
VYESWKALTSMLIRGFQNCNFPSWNVPSLYVVGKYLRLFAIKSDAERTRAASFNPSGAELMQDDFDPEAEKQAQLRDCEQHLKRMFTLCLSDRAELDESRKWGIYYIINLLFKTYFKLNSASLSRTILKTLAVYKDKGDMPALEAFPKAQRVTFKYYEGVLFFLEENYLEVGAKRSHGHLA